MSDDDDDRYLIPPDKPNVRQCPGCWRAGFLSAAFRPDNIHRFVHELQPCYPGCHTNDQARNGG
jgi:hypothetical protein